MADPFYLTPEWRALSADVCSDGRCAVELLLGGACDGPLHAHHIIPRVERPDLELVRSNLAPVCRRHHPRWEAVARAIRRDRDRDRPKCRHRHPYPGGREECEARMARELALTG